MEKLCQARCDRVTDSPDLIRYGLIYKMLNLSLKNLNYAIV
jgi:hypothetical protein